jgi:hypothetical protein
MEEQNMHRKIAFTHYVKSFEEVESEALNVLREGRATYLI